MPPRFSSDLATADWAVLAGYFLLLAVSGVWFARREQRDTDDYFLGGRRMPVWAVGVSIVATSMSAASFIGVPQQAYTGDLTYLSTNIGMVLAAFVVAYLFMPAFYRRRVRTIYELLDQRYGPAAMRAASGAYMVGRVMASGVRVFIGSIPASVILFGDRGLEPASLCFAITILTLVGIVYTLAGGIASIIWTDVIQMGVLLGACALAILLVVRALPVPASEAIALLGAPPDGGPSKLTLVQVAAPGRPWWTLPFSLPAVIVGFTLMGVASYGTDQDLTQRMLTCRDEKAAARSVLSGILFGIPSVAMFLVVGLLLWLFYHPAAWEHAPGPAPAAPDDSRRVFLDFIIHEMPPGLSGLMMAGLFAAGLSSLNSGINAMASTFINDFYRRLRPDRTEAHYLRAGRLAVVGWGVVLGGFAVLCVFIQTRENQFRDDGTLLTFALTVMTYAYAGLVPVFLTALLGRRGSAAGVITMLVTGFVAVTAMQDFAWRLAGTDLHAIRSAFASARELDPHAARPLPLTIVDLAFVWKLTIASALAWLIGWPVGLLTERQPPTPPA